MDIETITRRVDRSVSTWGPNALRIVAALLWLSNVSWKVPPDFGRVADGCSGLCRFVQAGSEFPLAPGTAWLFESLISPNLAVFGWLTLAVEASLAVLLLSGRWLRVAAVLGIAQSLAILLSVGNAEGEWYWSYILMVALHFALLVLAPAMRPTPARAMAVVTISYGVLVAIAHAGGGLGGADGDWAPVFDAANDLPGDFLRNVFPGSIGLGLLIAAAGVAAWFVAAGPDRWRAVSGWSLVGVSALLLLTYGTDGLVLGLGSRATTVCVLAALGLSLTVPRGREEAQSETELTPEVA